ncbi:MAG: hypothetical protein WBN04_03135 [Paracoccaceae bacterium]
MKYSCFLYVLLSAATPCAPAMSADFSDPTWPCIQKKVEDLSLGVMWPHPVPDAPLRAELDDAPALVATLALRRVSLEEADRLIENFAQTHGDLTTDELGQIFKQVFDRIKADRRAIIKGIERYSQKQIALSEAIDETRVAMDTNMAAENPDFDEVDRLEEKLDWDERIFHDRAQSLTYVCETPVLLEKRAYAIAQALLKHAP